MSGGAGPLIVIGMHRSGTSVLVRAIERLGVFMGWRKRYGDEAAFFVGINEWLLRQSGGAWDHPEPFRRLVQQDEIRALTVEYIRLLMRSPRIIGFLGIGRYLRCRVPERLASPWGWKDPRNTFTLPVWLDCFPDARVIHVHRHGVDVAHSLRTRHEQTIAAASARQRRLRRLRWLRPKRGGFADSVRCATLPDAFCLWEEYVAEARRHVRLLNDRAFEMGYERLVDDPRTRLAELAQWIGVTARPAALDAVASLLSRDRAYAYRRSAKLCAFAERMAAPLKALGY
jgi:hypothetical protein